MCDDRAFVLSLTDQSGKMVCLVIETAVSKRLIEFHDTSIHIMNGGAHRIPPVGVDQDVTSRSAQQRIAAAREIYAGMQLCHAKLMFGLYQRQAVDARRAQPAHGLHASQ